MHLQCPSFSSVLVFSRNEYDFCQIDRRVCFLLKYVIASTSDMVSNTKPSLTDLLSLTSPLALLFTSTLETCAAIMVVI